MSVPGRPRGHHPRAGEELPYPRFQHQITDWLALGDERHLFHALLEVDVTEARARIRAERVRTGEPLSLTGFLIGCFARAIAQEPRVGAVRHGRRRMVIFPDVDVALPVESSVEQEAIPVPHIIRAAQRQTPSEISREIGQDRAAAVPYARARRWLGAWLLVPGPLRRFVIRAVLRDAYRRRRLTGTVMATSVVRPGSGRAWGLPGGINYPLALTIGGLHRRRAGGVAGARGSAGAADPRRSGAGADDREMIALTLSFDHETVNGAPAARFVHRFAALVERGTLLPAAPTGRPT